MTITPAQVQEIRELLAKAASGKLVVEGSIYEGMAACVAGEDGRGKRATVEHFRSYQDAKLFAAAVNLLPDLLDSHERMKEALLRGLQHYEARSDLYTSDAECAAGMADILRLALHSNDGERNAQG